MLTKKYKIDSWNKFIESIEPNSNSKEIWANLNRLTGKQNQKSSTLLSVEQFFKLNFASQPKKTINREIIAKNPS